MDGSLFMTAGAIRQNTISLSRSEKRQDIRCGGGEKISLKLIGSTWVESSLRARNEMFLLVDDSGLVIMSPLLNWKFRTGDFTSHLVCLGKCRMKREICPCRSILSLCIGLSTVIIWSICPSHQLTYWSSEYWMTKFFAIKKTFLWIARWFRWRVPPNFSVCLALSRFPLSLMVPGN